MYEEMFRRQEVIEQRKQKRREMKALNKTMKEAADEVSQEKSEGTETIKKPNDIVR